MGEQRARSVRRWSSLAAAAVAAVGLTACEPAPVLDLVVTSTADAVDASPGDGVCETATPGECTLRAAVMESNASEGYDRITLPAGATIVLSIPEVEGSGAEAGDLDVLGHASVVGQGATIDGGGVDRVVFVGPDADVRVADLTVTGGDARHGGGLLNQGRLSLDGVVVTGNRAELTGGGILNSSVADGLVVTGSTISANDAGSGAGLLNHAALSIVGSSVTDNHATVTGGGIWNLGTGTASALAVTVSGNTAGGLGGGLYNQGSFTGTDLTVSGNSASTGGGAANAGSLELVFATVASNTAGTGSGGGLAVATSPATGGTATVTASVVAGNVGGDCDAGITSGGHNVDGDGTCLALPATGDQVASDPVLGPLGENGGTTRTHLPAPSSPAVDAVPAGTAPCDGSVAVDQRIVPRPQGAGCDAGAVELEALPPGPLIVDDAGDGGDAVPGDGACDTGAGVCTLRAAVEEANADPGASEITVTPGLVTITVAAELDVTAPLTLHGGGATVSGGGTTRVLDVHAAAVTLHDLTVRDGLVATEGAGVRAVDSDVVLDGVTLTANQATAGDGGGLHQTGGTLAVTGSSIAENGAAGEFVYQEEGQPSYCRYTETIGRGGGVFATGAVVTVVGSEISGNAASDDGGGVYQDAGSLEVTSTLVHANHADGVDTWSCDDSSADENGAGGGIRSAGTGTTIRTSTITANVASGTGGGLHVGSSAAEPDVLVIEDSTIADNSAAGESFFDDYDWLCRYTDTAGRGGGVFATGAAVTVVGSEISGNVASDEGGGVYQDAGSLEVTSTLVHANHADGVDAWSCIGDSSEDENGAGGGIRSAGTGTTIRTSSITANVASGTGGGLHVGSGAAEPDELVVEDSTIADNRADGDYFSSYSDGYDHSTYVSPRSTGGGIHGERVTVLRSTIDGNDANRKGGGVHAQELVLTASTVSGNHAGGVTTDCYRDHCTDYVVGQGGGVQTLSALTATNATLHGNVADEPASGGAAWTEGSASFRYATVTGNLGGALAGSGTLELHGSIVSGNGGGNCVQPADVSEYTVSPHASCGAEPALQVATTLDPLADNGGPTLSRLPAPGSVSIDVIPAVLCTVATDQRGVARPQGAGCDAGAVELEVVVSGPLIVDDAGDGGDAVPGDGACDTGAGVCTLRAAVDEANADPEASEITITPGLPTITVAAEVDVTAPLTLHGGGATVSGGGTTRVLDVHAAAVTLHDLTVRDGLVATEGGGVRAVDADIVLDGVTLTANQATAGDGGGIHQTGGTLAVTGSTIAGNGAAGESTIDTSDCLVRITSSIGRGGGVFATGASVAVTDSEISDNTASDDGGGIHQDAGSLEVTSTLVHANHADGFTDRSYDFCADYSTDATDGAGGGIRSSGTGTTIRMSTITANVASGAGGGVHVAGPAVAVVEDSTIAGNRAEGTYDSYDGDPSYPWNGDGPTGTGGGIHGERVTVLRSTLDGNDANNRGGGVHADELVLTASTVSGNHAGGIRTSCGPENCTNTVVGQAGGVYTHWVLDATNVTFDGNVSDAPSSGGAAWTRSTASFRFATVVGNQGGALAGSGNLELHGSIVSDNGGGNCVQAADVSEHTVSPHAACGAEPALQVATTFGPLAANGGPTLTRLPAPGSVSIDVIPAELCDGTVPTDQRGVARPQGAGCDAGAVEQ